MLAVMSKAIGLSPPNASPMTATNSLRKAEYGWMMMDHGPIGDGCAQLWDLQPFLSSMTDSGRFRMTKLF
jgi:hypothetical protein